MVERDLNCIVYIVNECICVYMYTCIYVDEWRERGGMEWRWEGREGGMK